MTLLINDQPLCDRLISTLLLLRQWNENQFTTKHFLCEERCDKTFLIIDDSLFYGSAPVGLT